MFWLIEIIASELHKSPAIILLTNIIKIIIAKYIHTLTNFINSIYIIKS